MKVWKLFCMCMVLIAATSIAHAASYATHKETEPVKGTAEHNHDKDGSSREDNDSSSEDESELHEQMEVLGKNFKKLGRLFRSDSPDVGEALKYTAACKKAAAAVKGLVPEIVEEMEEGKKKEEAREQYQAQIKKLIKTFTQLEAVLKENDTAKAKALVNLLKKHKKDGHDKFTEEDE